MPARWVQALIVLFWVVMTTLLVRRDVLPKLGFGELSYRQVVANRAVPESTHWTIEWNGRRLGSTLTIVRPNPNGSYNLLNRTNLSSAVLDHKPVHVSTQVIISSDFHVDPLGQLKGFASKISVEGTKLEINLDGVVQGEELKIKNSGLSLLPEEMTVQVPKDMMMVDVVAPLDKIPDLRVGKKWASQTINPVALLFASGPFFGPHQPPMDTIHHEVTETDALSWNGRSWYCFVIEHTHPSGRSKTWVRVKDGRVLRHEVPIGGAVVVLEPDPRLGAE